IGGHRVYTRPDLPVAGLDPHDDVAAKLGFSSLQTDVVPLGQDAAFAAPLAQRFRTTGSVVQAIAAAIDRDPRTAADLDALAPDQGFAAAHRVRYPVAQGPMTRVSDRAAFARSVADGGGLPFLALALLRGPEVRALLAETAELLGDRPWGVG